MPEIIPVTSDFAKNVFQAHSADTSKRAALRKKLRWEPVMGMPHYRSGNTWRCAFLASRNRHAGQ